MKKLVFLVLLVAITGAAWAQVPATINPDFKRAAANHEADGHVYVNSLVFFKLDAVDNETGLKFIEFSLDSENFMKYQSPFQILEDGPKEIAYRAYDNSGNLEVAKTYKVIVDNAAPAVSLETDVPLYTKGLVRYCSPATKWFVRATDNNGGSGVGAAYIGTNISSLEAHGVGKAEDAAYYSLSTEGNVEIYFTAIDNVQNLAPIALATVTVDATPPVVFIENSNRLIKKDLDYTVFPSENVVDKDGRIIVSSTEAVAFGAKDDASGVEAIYVKINNGEYTKYISPIKFATAEKYDIEVKAIDNVGNESKPMSYTFFVDKINPESVIQLITETGKPLSDTVPATK